MQPAPGSVEVYASALLSHVADSLARAGKDSHVLSRHARFLPDVSRRTESGTPEIHDAWVDVTVVQAGRAVILTGGHLTGGHVESPGEHRGGTIVGGESHPIAIGDLFVIPAGVPHQFQLARGDSLRYLTIKVAK